MLTNVEVITRSGKRMDLPLDESSAYFVKDIEGINPVQATLVSSSFALMDGSQYHSSRRENRNIVIKLALMLGGEESASQLRSQLYGFFMPKMEVRLRFFVEGMQPVDIIGRIETFEAPMFTQEPEATISIICFKPDFFTTKIQRFFGMSTSDTSDLSTIDYEGSVETGLSLIFKPSHDIRSFVFQNLTPGGENRIMEFEMDLKTNDIVTINTVAGEKSVMLTRGGSDASVLYGVSPYSDWINLYPGENQIQVKSLGSPMPYTIEYTTKFGGL